jgi:hypothetical protein
MPMKSAAELWETETWETYPEFEVFVRAIQADALEAAAKVCREKSDYWRAEAQRIGSVSNLSAGAKWCADAIAALIPKPEGE